MGISVDQFINEWESLAEDFFKGFPFGQLIDEFVQITNLAFNGVFYFLDSIAADYSFDESGIGIELGARVKEGFKGVF